MDATAEQGEILSAMIGLSEAILAHLREAGPDGADPDELGRFFEQRGALFARLSEASPRPTEVLMRRAAELLELDRMIVAQLERTSQRIKDGLAEVNRGKRALKGYRHQTRPRGSTMEA